MKASLQKLDVAWILIPLVCISMWMALPRAGRRLSEPEVAPPEAQKESQAQHPDHRRPLGREELLPVDATVFELSAATGGDFYFWSPGEFAAVASGLKVPMGGEAVLLIYDELDEDLRRFEFPVDGATERLELFVGAQRLDEVHVTRPSGVESDLDPGTTWQAFDRMRIVAIERPEAGRWSVELRGQGRFQLTVHSGAGAGSREPIECIDFDFVERGGRPGHEGLFPLQRPLHRGEQALLEVDLDGSFRETEVRLVGIDGRELCGALEPALLSDAEDDGRLYLSTLVPERPFRVLVRGIDASGADFQRVFPSSVEPKAPLESAGTDVRWSRGM